jgi:hypothetical protein
MKNVMFRIVGSGLCPIHKKAVPYQFRYDLVIKCVDTLHPCTTCRCRILVRVSVKQMASAQNFIRTYEQRKDQSTVMEVIRTCEKSKVLHRGRSYDQYSTTISSSSVFI